MKTHTAKAKEHLKTHAVNALALILGVGRERLTRALSDAGMRTNEKMTVAQAFTALSAKFQKEDDRNRRQKAEADSAELDAAKKRGETMFTKDVEIVWADRTIAQRKLILTRPVWKTPVLLSELAKIKLDEK